MLRENELSHIIIGLAIEVHTSLGPGLLERSYQECLYHKLCKAGIIVEKQKAMPLVFEEV
jgi:GxxExxY protein